jgi:hypothetical protein
LSAKETFSIKNKEIYAKEKIVVSNIVPSQIYQFLTVDRTERHEMKERIE